MAVFILLIFVILSITFGIVGLCGMFIGQGISKIFGNISKGNGKSKAGDKDIRIEKIKTLAVISTSLISGVISIIIALIK